MLGINVQSCNLISYKKYIESFLFFRTSQLPEMHSETFL